MKPNSANRLYPVASVAVGLFRNIAPTKPLAVSAAQTATNRTKKATPSATRARLDTGLRGCMARARERPERRFGRARESRVYWNRRSTISFADGSLSMTRFDFRTFTANSMNGAESFA